MKEGCRSLPGLPATVASGAGTYPQDPSGALVVPDHGPWYQAGSMGEAGIDPAFAREAADANAFDRTALTSLTTGDPTRVTTSVAQLTRDCRALGQSTGSPHGLVPPPLIVAGRVRPTSGTMSSGEDGRVLEIRSRRRGCRSTVLESGVSMIAG